MHDSDSAKIYLNYVFYKKQ